MLYFIAVVYLAYQFLKPDRPRTHVRPVTTTIPPRPDLPRLEESP